MKHLNLKALAFIMAGSLGASALSVDASAATAGNNAISAQFAQQLNSQKHFSVRALEEDRNQLPNSGRQNVTKKDPELSFKTLPNYDYMIGPDGSMWFYVVEYEYEDIVFSEYYTEHLKRAFTFTIFDNHFNKVGVVHDKIRFAEDEAWQGPNDANGNPTWFGRDMESTLHPQVTRNFFNTDDKLEIMVFHAMNTPSYVNHYYYSVYQIDGAKDEDGNDLPVIDKIEGRCLDAINYDDGSGQENYVITFALDPVVDWPLDDPKALEKLHASYFDLYTYTKATDDKGPKMVYNKHIGNTHIPGDTTDGMYFITKQEGGNLYFIYSQYEKPCFVDPRGGAIDESQTPDNNLMIEVYKFENGVPALQNTVHIPVEEIKSDEQLMYSFYSIGSVAWKDDIDMKVNGSTAEPAFIVNHEIVAAANLEGGVSSYDLYNSKAEKIRTVALASEGLMIVNNVKSEEPIALLAQLTEDGQSVDLVFRKFYSGEVIGTMSQKNNGDPVFVNSFAMFNDGKDENGLDKFKYAFEMQYMEEADNGDQLVRVAWFDNNLQQQRVDRINVGQGVQAFLVNMDPNGLTPDTYDADENMEYAVLVKRTNPATGTTRNEFIVVDDDGSRYARFDATEGKGDPVEFTVLPGDTKRLMMVYQDDNFKFNVDLYDLPFLEKDHLDGVENIVDNAVANLRYDGENVYAEGASIEIYSIGGVKEAMGQNSVSVKDLSSGVYVVVAKDANGKMTTVKIKK